MGFHGIQEHLLQGYVDEFMYKRLLCDDAASMIDVLIQFCALLGNLRVFRSIEFHGEGHFCPFRKNRFSNKIRSFEICFARFSWFANVRFLFRQTLTQFPESGRFYTFRDPDHPGSTPEH